MTGWPGGGKAGQRVDKVDRQNLKAPLSDGYFLLFLVSEALFILMIRAVSFFAVLFFRESLQLFTGDLVFLSSLTSIGIILSAVAVGWSVDRFGVRPLRVTLLILQGLFFSGWLFLKPGIPRLYLIVGALYIGMGFLTHGIQSTGMVYLMNNVPQSKKESYTALYYASGGITGGISMIGAGILLNRLEALSLVPGSQFVDPYRILFVIAFVFSLLSAALFTFLREEESIGIGDFLKKFFRGRTLRALWNIFLFNSSISENRRMRMSERLGTLGTSLAEDELFYPSQGSQLRGTLRDYSVSWTAA